MSDFFSSCLELLDLILEVSFCTLHISYYFAFLLILRLHFYIQCTSLGGLVISPQISYFLHLGARCLKITEKVSFNASEASYVYILSGQKLINNAKYGQILASF